MKRTRQTLLLLEFVKRENDNGRPVKMYVGTTQRAAELKRRYPKLTEGVDIIAVRIPRTEGL